MTPAPAINDLFSTEDFNDGSIATRDSAAKQGSGERTYGDNNVDLPEDLQHALLALVQEAQRQDLFQRRLEVVGDRRRRFYERGIQHVYPDMVTGLFVQGTPGAVIPDGNNAGSQIQCGQFLNDYNIFARALQIIIAKLSENPVGVDFQPDSADSSADLQASEAAEAYRMLYDRRNDSKDLLTAIVRMMGVSGRTVAWTRTVSDAQKWGTDETGQPRRVQTTTIYGSLESKVPIMATGLETCPYLIITEDPHLYIAKAKYPEFADKIVEGEGVGISDTQFERMARIGALQGASASYQLTDTFNWYVEEKHCFFRPSMFTSKQLDCEYREPDSEEFRTGPDGEAWTLRDALNEAFPAGVCVTFVGDQYVGSRNCNMDDELMIDFPYAGDGMSRMSIMEPAVVIQDDFNDDENNYHEVKVTGWPSTWVNEDYADLAALNDQVAAPYCFRALKNRPPRESKMSDAFFREPNPEIPASFMEHTEYMATQLLQYILAIPSAVQGAGMPDQKTASGYTAALNQALGQLGVIWGAVQRLMAGVYRQAAMAAAREDTDSKPIVIPGPKGQSITVSMADLAKGRFLAHPDVDSGYPESTVQKRSTFFQVMQLAATSPQLAEALFSSPDNWDFFARTMGIPEITLPEAKSRRKQIAEIEILLQQGPQPASPQAVEQATIQHASDTMAGAASGHNIAPFDPASIPPQSSIPPDPLDFHQWEFEECREFLSDYPKVQQQINAGNQVGIDNVRLHAHEHQQYLMQEAAAAMAQQQAAQPQPGQPAAPKKAPPKQEPQTPQPPIQ